MELPAVGPAGFEGLVRDVLAEVSGGAFRLMKSGPQGGVDALGEPNGNALAIGMEGKRYAPKTRLPLDALKSKLRDTAATFPDLDLWVLAVTRGIDGGDARALAETGAELGVDALVLDWPEEGALPPPLAILCAAAPAATAHHLADNPSAAADISRVRDGAFYAGEAARLRERLRNPAVGLAATTAMMRDWVRERLRDGAAARTAFDSNATLEAEDARRIARPAIDLELDRWWTDPTRPAALLGMEGMGKTWALLGWWLARVEADPTFPLTVVIPARDVRIADAPGLVARALHQATGVRDEAFWRRRVSRWSTIRNDRPVVLLAIDGLNQNWRFKGWSDLAVSAATPAWRGRIAVAFTCRPDHWENRLKALSDVDGDAVAIRVGPFDDPELDGLLALHGLSRAEITPSLLELMRRPRLSGLAIRRRGDLGDVGEVTAERLVYEDWRHRHPGARRALSHEEFKAFVAELGQSARAGLDRAPLSRSDLLSRLSADGGGPSEDFQVVLSELIDGGWLEPDASPHRFRLHAERVPAALALTLVADLKATAEVEEAEEGLASLLEPLQDSDLAVAILRNAATFALLDADARPAIRRLLLQRWIGAQNFSPPDFEAYWRLVGLDPELVLDIAEVDWFREHGHSRADEVLVKGFGNAWRWPEVANAVRRRLVPWFSRYWLDWLEGEVIGHPEDDERAAERRRSTEARAAMAADERVAGRFGLELRLVGHEGQGWGAHRAVELLSWLPRAPLIDAFTAWAITHVIMNHRRQAGVMAWVLRWNEEDSNDAEVAVLDRARSLLDAGGPVARDAAKALLDALASPAARSLRDAEFPPAEEHGSQPPSWRDLADGKSRPRPLVSVASLDADALDPSLELPEGWTDHLERLATETTDEALLDTSGAKASGLEYASVALARWAPKTLASLVRRRFAAAINEIPLPLPPPSRWARLRARVLRRAPTPNPPLAVPILAKHLPGAMIALTDEELAPWRALSRRAIAEGVPAPFALHAAALAGAAAREQIAILSRTMPDEGPPDWSIRLLEPPLEEDLAAIADQLEPTRPASALVPWTRYLEAAPRGARPDGWKPLARLTGHPDATVRTAAFRLAVQERDAALADVVDRSGWRATAEMGREEAAWGSLALALAPGAADGSMVERVHPDALGRLTATYPSQSAYLAAFAEHVRSELEYLRTVRSRAYPRSLMNVPRGWDELVDSRRTEFAEWMRPFLEDDAAVQDLLFLPEQFPLMHALDAMDRLTPGAKAGVVVRALEASKSGNMRSGVLYDLAVQVDGEGAEEARELALWEANDDAKLLQFASGLQHNGHGGWLLARIQRDLAAQSAGTVARGLVLAGFLTKSDEHDAWWVAHDKPPATGWLAKVHTAARAEYRRAGHVRHWSARYREAADEIEALCAHVLFSSGADGRALIDGSRPSDEEIRGWSWRRRVHWTVGWKEARATVKKHEDRLAKRFLASDLPSQNQSPRRQ